MDTWLAEFVAQHMSAQAAADPEQAPLLAAAGGMRLYGTIGAVVFLRPDGTTIALVEGSPGQPDYWEPDDEGQRTASIAVALRRFPELQRLLPKRPGDATDCAVCAGTGRLHDLVCGACSGLGWRNAPAT